MTYPIYTMDQIKILIIDKNILVRRAITMILQKKEGFQIFWENDEFERLAEVIKQIKPDVILLSVESLAGDGLELLQKLQTNFAQLPVIVISPRSEAGAKAAITALRLGAIDFLTKPEQKNLILFAERHLEKRLAPMIKAIYSIKERDNLDKEMLESLAQPQKSFEEFPSVDTGQLPKKIVVMGGCTGGVQTLFALLSKLPADLNIPIVAVQHLPKKFTGYLAEHLDAFCDITVREVQNREQLLPGNVYIAPGGYQCEVCQDGSAFFATIHRGPRENNMRPSIDVLFRSVAKTYGSKALAVLLSGCGYDGLAGTQEIRKHYGQVIVQDPRTAIAPELPLSALSKGITKEYYTPDEIASLIIKSTDVAEKEELDFFSEKDTSAGFLF